MEKNENKIMAVARLSITLPPRLYEDLKKRRKEVGTSISAQIRVALEKTYKK